MTKGRKMEPRPSNTKGSLSFSSGAMDSKSLAKNSSGSLALVRGLRRGARRRRLGVARARRRPRVRTRARASGPGPAGRLGASRLCGVIAPRARTRRRRPARGAGVVTHSSTRRRRDRGLLAAEPRTVGAQTSARPSERERHAVFGPGEALRRERAAGHDSTLSFTIAAAAKTAVFIIVTARGCFSMAEPSSASMLARART